MDGAVAEQELDLFQVAAVPAAELGAGAPKVMRAETLDANLLGRLLDDTPDRPIAQAIADLAPLRMERSSLPSCNPDIEIGPNPTLRTPTAK
jgi:hypothetical protein